MKLKPNLNTNENEAIMENAIFKFMRTFFNRRRAVKKYYVKKCDRKSV